jgi:molecular chaperone GrpE
MTSRTRKSSEASAFVEMGIDGSEMEKREKDEEKKESAETSTEPADGKLSDSVEELTKRLAAKEAEAAANYDKFVRAAADLDNYRKRAAKEKAEALKYGNETLIRDILPFLDGVDRALQHATKSEDFEAFRQGLALLRDQLLHALEKHGVQRLETLGKDFDPNFHEAMLHVETDEHDHNKVIEEHEKGYLLNDRLLRAARVSVSKNTRRATDLSESNQGGR